MNTDMKKHFAVLSQFQVTPLSTLGNWHLHFKFLCSGHTMFICPRPCMYMLFFKFSSHTPLLISVSFQYIYFSMSQRRLTRCIGKQRIGNVFDEMLLNPSNNNSSFLFLYITSGWRLPALARNKCMSYVGMQVLYSAEKSMALSAPFIQPDTVSGASQTKELNFSPPLRMLMCQVSPLGLGFAFRWLNTYCIWSAYIAQAAPHFSNSLNIVCLLLVHGHLRHVLTFSSPAEMDL